MKTIVSSSTKPSRELRVEHRAMSPPMAGIETHLFVAILRYSALRQPMDMVLAKGETLEAGKWSSIDLKVMMQWFKLEGGKARP
jgi:hypothetical protein